MQEQNEDHVNTLKYLNSKIIVTHTVSNRILGVWRDPITGKKVFTTQKDMRPKPKYREMSLKNPNVRPDHREVIADNSA